MNEMKTVEQIMNTSPQTLHDAVTRGLQIIEKYDPKIFEEVKTQDDFVISLHHGLGQHMRNYWGLWSQDSGLYEEVSKKYDLEHADDISSIVLYAMYQTKHDGIIDEEKLEQVAQNYKEHWEKYEQ